MIIEQIREVFGTKIYLEFEQYRLDMIQKTPEEIFNNSYQNECYITMYEYLLIMSENLSEDEMIFIICHSDFLAFLYAEWLKTNLGHDELYGFIQSVITERSIKWKEVA